MAFNPANVRVGANGSLHVAALDVDPPASISASYPTGWVDLGALSEDGVTLNRNPTVTDIGIWQSFYPVRSIMDSIEFTVAAVMREWGREQLILAFGGGTVTEDAPGEFRYTPPAPEFIDERQIIAEWIDGDNHYRAHITRAIISNNVETKLVRNAAADLPITMKTLGQDGVEPYFLMTDDLAFSAVTSP
jgi:hypothetical protein